MNDTTAQDGAWDVETGGVVVGGGGTGLVTAITLAAHGVQTTLLEKGASLGGTTAKSGGSIVAAGSAPQADAGIADSPAALQADIQAKNGGEASDDRVRAIAEESPRTIDWLQEALGLELTVNTGPYGRIGHRTFRRHWLLDGDGEVQRDGRYLVGELATAADDAGVEVLTDTPVRRIVGTADGVGGVVAGATDERIRAEAVFLACGGFGADPALRRDRYPAAGEPVFAGAPTNTGAALDWAESIGARTADLDAFNVIGHFTHPEGIHFPWALSKAGAFVVNSDGERFADIATASYSTFAGALLDQPDQRGYIIFDEFALNSMLEDASSARLIRECLDHDAFASAASIDDLAAKLDLPQTAVQTAYTDVNRSRHRKLSAPLYGSAIQPAILGTLGGMEPTPRGEIIDRDGDPIPGLYGGGLATVGISGSDPSGYLSGNGLLYALNSGRLMAKAALADVYPDGA